MDSDYRKTDKQGAVRSVDPDDYQSLPVDLAVMPKRFEDGHVVPPHQHRRDQVIYGETGLMRISTSEDTWVVPPDRALFMPAGVIHSVEFCGDVEMSTLYITPSKPAEIKVLPVAPLLRQLIASLACEPMDYSNNPRAQQIADLIMTELRCAEALPLNIPLPRDPRLQRLCQRLLRDPSLNVSLEHLADEAGASSKTLARLFANELGMGFSAWRRRVRFSKAMELLGRDQPMQRVAQCCGYDSPSAFTYAFRKEFGMSPRAFQRR